MRIFIGYTVADEAIVQKITARLKQDKHTFWSDTNEVQSGNIQAAIESALADADVVITVLSENSFNNTYQQYVFSTLSLQNASRGQRPSFAVKIDKSTIPTYLEASLVVDLSDSFEVGLEQLCQMINSLEVLQNTTKKGSASKSQSKTKENQARAIESQKQAASIDNRSAQIGTLSGALRRGRLTLVCGAGTSVAAGIPPWNQLLIKLLARVMDKMSSKKSGISGEEIASKLQEQAGASSLILGKYLKNSLGQDFASSVRDIIYSSNPTTSDLIENIALLSQPQRDGKPLDSILTFNFDCLIEDALAKAQIPYQEIYCDPISHSPNMLPVYHVHGFLPRSGDIPIDSTLVFAEDAYHTQFIDPFSWSNLMLLSKLTQNTCLFVGISLTDPNMRRLLDVAWRKKPRKELSHYLIKKVAKPSGDELFDQISKTLEEQDANALGLGVIWITDYDEIGPILKEIGRNS